MEEKNYEYALVLRGNTYEYELHATAKLFIPGVRFCICLDDILPEGIPNYIIAECERTEHGISCGVSVQLGDRFHKQGGAVLGSEPPSSEVEYLLCRTLYDILQKMTGYTPPWGLLTGIRPVRKVVQALESGKTPDAVRTEMQKRFLISDEKMQLAMDTALIQMPILPHSAREIGLYVSIPFCPTRCSYCSFVSHSMDSAMQLIPEYVNHLCKEIAIWGEIIRRYDLSVQSVYIGGGTPTSVSAEQLQQIMQAIADHITSPVQGNTPSKPAVPIRLPKPSFVSSMIWVPHASLSIPRPCRTACLKPSAADTLHSRQLMPSGLHGVLALTISIWISSPVCRPIPTVALPIRCSG